MYVLRQSFLHAFCSEQFRVLGLTKYKGFRNADLQRNEMGQRTELTPDHLLLAFLGIPKVHPI